MKTHKVTGGGAVQLHVVEMGSQMVVQASSFMIHGISQCSRQWGQQMHSSLADNHRLITLDIGYAGSRSLR